MFFKRAVVYKYARSSVDHAPSLPDSRQRRRAVSAAPLSSTLVTESNKYSIASDSIKHGGTDVFLSRGDCLEVLKRITDSCLAVSMHKDAAAFAENLDAHGEASLMSQVFDALYDDAEEVFMSKGGYVIPKREAALVEATGGSPTYGEITGEGVTQFLRRVPLRPDDVLVDLGSGLGRLVLQVACSARLRRCVGIELSASRHEEACWVAAQLAHLNDEHNGRDGHGTGPWITGPSTSDGEVARTFMLRPHGPGTAPESSLVAMAEEDWMFQGGSHGGGQRGGGLLLSPVELRCEDLMAADLADGSVFFLCSTAFSSAACRAIAERLYCHPRFRVLVTSRALPFPSPLTLLGQFQCGFSWTAAGVAYVYIRSLGEAPGEVLAAFLSATTINSVLATAGAHGCGEVSAVSAPGVGCGGGVAWLPSTCTVPMVPGDLLV